jgi:hypothetical protein
VTSQIATKNVAVDLAVRGTTPNSPWRNHIFLSGGVCT